MGVAKVFKSGNSQAVRLPKEFQLDVTEVNIFRRDGDIALRPAKRSLVYCFTLFGTYAGNHPMVAFCASLPPLPGEGVDRLVRN